MRVPSNKPLERAGMTASRTIERARAGRSAPIRWRGRPRFERRTSGLSGKLTLSLPPRS